MSNRLSGILSFVASGLAIAAGVASIVALLTICLLASTPASAVTIGPAPITLPATRLPPLDIPICHTLVLKSSGGIPSGGTYYKRHCAAGEKAGSVKVVLG